MAANRLKKYFLPFVVLFSAVLHLSAHSEERTISYYGSSGPYLYKNEYFVSLLESLFAKTQTSATGVKFQLVSEKLSQNRIVELMSKRCIADIIWMVSSDEREIQLLPIRIPLLKGLSGYRSLMIRQDKQAEFDKITTEQQLAAMSAGQGYDWPDTHILQHNGYNVLPVNNFLALFDMLEDNRFDYFPRGVTEIAAELQHFKARPLTAERNFMLYYPSPVYFFVCPAKPQLAERIARGLEAVIEDGSFDELFYQSSDYQSFQAAGGFNSKRIFPMSNPYLNMNTLAKDTSLWLTPENHGQQLVARPEQ